MTQKKTIFLLVSVLIILGLVSVLIFFLYTEQQNQKNYDAAINEQRAELCSKISSQDIRNSCFSKLAESLKDSTICDKIEPEQNTQYSIIYAESTVHNYKKDYCYQNVAIATKNSSLCEKISLDYNWMVDDCKRQVNQSITLSTLN